jgi:uncharacterized protein
MVKLTDLGFAKDVIAEVIVSTYSADGKPNAAPMGALMQDEVHLTISIYNTSKTLKNLTATKSAAVNLTSDVDVFYRTAFKEANPNGKLPHEWFEKSEAVNAPRLCVADAAIDVSVIGLVADGAEKTKVTFLVQYVCAGKSYPQAYNRAMSATVEAIIHATRVKVLVNDEKEQKRVGKLLAQIENCQDVVNRVAPKSQYSALMAELASQIDSWRRKA